MIISVGGDWMGVGDLYVGDLYVLPLQGERIAPADEGPLGVIVNCIKVKALDPSSTDSQCALGRLGH